jgi:hypothetical protein
MRQLRRFSPDLIISNEMGARTLLALVFRKLNPETRLIIWAEAVESTESGRGWVRQLGTQDFCQERRRLPRRRFERGSVFAKHRSARLRRSSRSLTQPISSALP